MDCGMLKARHATLRAGYGQARWQMVRHGSVGQGTALFGRVSFGAARVRYRSASCGSARHGTVASGMAMLGKVWLWVRASLSCGCSCHDLENM